MCDSSGVQRVAIMQARQKTNLAVKMLSQWCLSSCCKFNSVKWFAACLAMILSWSVQIKRVDGFSPLWDSVKTQVFQEYEIISARGQLSVVRAKLGEIKKPELIVGENIKVNSRIILTCTAWYPSEWVYSGDADPTYTSNTTIENLGHNGQVLPLDDVNGAKRYVATIVIGPRGVKQSDTGRYNCMTASPETGMKFKTLSAFYHLFVPGKTLFIRKRGGTILYDLRKSPARIPCGVTNPKVAVSLQKFQSGHLVNVDNETMLYHPISGFYPRHDIPGTYVCTAAHNRAFELLHFTLVPKMTDSATLQNIKQSSEEDLEWLFNSFKLGHPNRLHLSTRPPAGYGSNEKRKKPRPTLSASYLNSGQKQSSELHTPTSIWKRPTPDDHKDAVVTSPGASNSNNNNNNNNNQGSNYRPVYVLFAEDLNRLNGKTTERPNTSISGSGSASTSASGSDESEEEGEEGDEEEQDQEKETEAEEEVESVEEKEPEHQYHFDPQTAGENNTPLLLHQLFSTRRTIPTTTQRPLIHREYATTYLPFLNFLNSNSAVVKYKPIVNPAESIIKYSNHENRRPTTQKPLSGQIVYDLQSNKLVYQESGFTRPTTDRSTRPTPRPSRFKIPSLPTQRWPSTRKTARPTTRVIVTTSTTPAPPTIPEAVVCINNPCGKHATCYANTVYYHKQKETRREPACKCIDKYQGNPYLECLPPSPVETDFLSFNSTNLFEKRSGMEAVASLEEGYLHSDVFPRSSDEPIIVDVKKK